MEEFISSGIKRKHGACFEQAFVPACYIRLVKLLLKQYYYFLCLCIITFNVHITAGQ